MTEPDASDLRLEALRRYAILDTPPERVFDDIVEAAAAFCDVPIALVSLVDRDRQWFKACLGLDVAETPVDRAVCALAILQPEPLVIPDLALDPRTAANPLVTEAPRIRFYAGAPLIDRDGHALGTVCVIDTLPRPEGLSPAQLRGLAALARQATHVIEMRSAVERGVEVDARIVRSESAQSAGRIGTFELDIASNTVRVSAEFCRLYGLPPVESMAAGIVEALSLSQGPAAHSTQSTREDGSAALDVEYRIRRADDGQVRWIARRARFEYAGGRPVRLLGTVQDVTERRVESQRVAALLELGDRLREVASLEEAIAEASAILGRELGVDRVGYASVDRASASFRIDKDWAAPGVASLVGVHPLAGVAVTLDRLAANRAMAIDNVPQAAWLGADRAAYAHFGAAALVNIPLLSRNELVGVLFVHSATPRSWGEDDIEFATGVGDRTYAAIAQLEAVAQRNVLNLELSHRMKNMLAMVQAIASRTLKDVRERDAVAAFDNRLTALGTAHDVLVGEHWASASVRGVAEKVFAALGAGDRVTVDGPAIAFGPRAALALSLLLHELTTNALKYGALSADGGSVALSWHVTGHGNEAEFCMAWRERGGPPAQEPARRGFGSRLIKMGLLGAGGTVTRYLPAGLEADVTAPLARAKLE